MKFIDNTYPHNLFNFEVSNDTLIQYEKTKDSYFVLGMFDYDFLTNNNKSYLEIEYFEFFNENILKSFIELKYLYENQNAISNELLLIENKNNLHITFLNYYNRYYYFETIFFETIDFLSEYFIKYFELYDNNKENENTLLSEISDNLKNYFIEYFELYEIIEVERNFIQFANYLNIDFYYNNKLDLFLPKNILYNTQTNTNTNADTETTGENQITETTGNYQITEKDLQLIKNAKKIEIGYIIKQFGGNRRTLCNIFVNKLKDKGLTINYNSIYTNLKSSYSPPKNFMIENKDLVNTIKNILI